MSSRSTGTSPTGSLANVSVGPPPGPPIDIGGVGLSFGGVNGMPTPLCILPTTGSSSLSMDMGRVGLTTSGCGVCGGVGSDNLSKIVPPSGNCFAKSLISGASSLISKLKSPGGCIGKGCCIAPSLFSKSSSLDIRPLGSKAGDGCGISIPCLAIFKNCSLKSSGLNVGACLFSNALSLFCKADGSN